MAVRRNCIRAVQQVVQHFLQAVQGDQPLNAPYFVGQVWEMCSTLRQLPKGDRVAAKRVIMQVQRAATLVLACACTQAARAFFSARAASR